MLEHFGTCVAHDLACSIWLLLPSQIGIWGSGVTSLVKCLVRDGAVWPVNAKDGTQVTSVASIKFVQDGLRCSRAATNVQHGGHA